MEEAPFDLRTLSEFLARLFTFKSQGRNPGLEFANAFGIPLQAP